MSVYHNTAYVKTLLDLCRVKFVMLDGELGEQFLGQGTLIHDGALKSLGTLPRKTRLQINI